jgi:hypothetical protein
MSLIKKIELVILLLPCVIYSNAQDNILNTVADQFSQNQQSILSEKIFAHTDKSFYLAGEILWFKLYYVDACQNKPLNLSKVAYVDILDKNQKSVLQGKIALNEGTGNGSLYLPVSLNSGVYRLRAYTNWMKNFSPDFYFEKSITIVNSLKSPDVQPTQSRNYDIQFFPEGGNLVQGIESKIAFRITDQAGKGIECRGTVIDANNDTVAKFQPLKSGIGNFTFAPVVGNTYKAIIKLADTIIIKELPVIYEQGYAMNVSNTTESQLHVTVHTNIKSADAVYLFVHTRQIMKVMEKSYLINGVTGFTIDKNKFGEGISQITIFDNEKKPVCERLFFIQPSQKLILQLSANQQQFTSRKKVDISISSGDESGKSLPADMSVSVYKTDSLQTIESDNISNYFWLTSDLKGNIESPDYYFSGKSGEIDEATDNLMLTHGWRRFTWQNVLQPAKAVFDFIPEWKGHIIRGKVTDIKTGLPAANITTYLSVPGNRIQLYASESDTGGNIRFYTKDFYGPNEIDLQSDSRTDTTYKLEITSPFSDRFSSKHLSSFDLPDNMKDPLLNYSIGVQIQNSFTGEKLKQFSAPAVDSNAFFGPPDKQYNLDDYTRFSTMEEVLREYVYEVLVRRQKENFRLIMADAANKIFMDDPFTLFNGVPVFDPNKIMRYDPLKVKKVEVVKRKYFYGPLILNGIANFITYHPDPTMLSDAHSIIMDYEGLQYQREFYSPVYETQEQFISRLPDFRNVLYWSPEVRTNASGKAEINFYTSDRKGKYIMVLQGLNADGKVGAQSFSFEVK